MAIPERPEPLDPGVEAAAEAGDVAAMRQLGQYLYACGSADRAEPWLLAAAEAGDAQAMYALSRVQHDRAVRATPHGEDHDLEAASWCRRAAEAGCVDAIRSMSSWSEPGEREFWLREAIRTGDPYAPSSLAGLLLDEGRTAEAEHLYREDSDVPGHIGHHARQELACFLTWQGRLEEAAGYWTRNAEAGSSVAARHLAGVLERLGRPQEAAVWRGRVDALRAREHEDDPPLR
jgi:TPR repeat protein